MAAKAEVVQQKPDFSEIVKTLEEQQAILYKYQDALEEKRTAIEDELRDIENKLDSLSCVIRELE